MHKSIFECESIGQGRAYRKKFSGTYAGDMQLNNVGIASFSLLRRRMIKSLKTRARMHKFSNKN